MEKKIEVILAIAIVGTALAFGGVQPIAYSLMTAVVLFLLLILLVRQTRSGRVQLPLPVWPILLAVLVLVQIVPLPSTVVEVLSPLRSFQSEPSATASWIAMSTYPRATTVALLRFLAYVSAFVLAAYLFDSGKRKSTLIRGLILLGCFEAVYGIVQYLTGWQKIFTYTKVYGLHDATGTYINRNHFAGLLGLVIPFVLASGFYAFRVWAQSGRASRSGRGAAESGSAGYRVVFYLFLLVVMVVAGVLSRSRMGIFAIIVSILFVAVLAQVALKRKAWALGVLLFLTCIAGYGLWIGLDPILARFERVGEPGYLEMEGRLSIYRDSVRLIRDYPLVGTGLGSFGVSFRRYQTAFVDKYVDHAHNDYLEFAAETGLLGATLLFAPILYLLARMVLSFLDDSRRYRRAVTLGCIGSTLALLLHSLTDFNLQIPANALVFSVVLGIGYKAAIIERRGENQVRHSLVGDADGTARPA